MCSLQKKAVSSRLHYLPPIFILHQFFFFFFCENNWEIWRSIYTYTNRFQNWLDFKIFNQSHIHQSTKQPATQQALTRIIFKKYPCNMLVVYKCVYTTVVVWKSATRLISFIYICLPNNSSTWSGLVKLIHQIIIIIHTYVCFMIKQMSMMNVLQKTLVVLLLWCWLLIIKLIIHSICFSFFTF